MISRPTPCRSSQIAARSATAATREQGPQALFAQRNPPEDASEGGRVERVPVENEVAHTAKEPVLRVSQLPCGLLHPASFGWQVIPAISTMRVLRRITKRTKYRTNPPMVSTSTVKKSAAARPSQ